MRRTRCAECGCGCVADDATCIVHRRSHRANTTPWCSTASAVRSTICSPAPRKPEERRAIAARDEGHARSGAHGPRRHARRPREGAAAARERGEGARDGPPAQAARRGHQRTGDRRDRGQYEEMHAERVEVLRKKVEAQEAELALAERDVGADDGRAQGGDERRGSACRGVTADARRGRRPDAGGVARCATRSTRSAARARAPIARRTPTAASTSSSARWGSSHPLGSRDCRQRRRCSLRRRRGRCERRTRRRAVRRAAHRRRRRRTRRRRPPRSFGACPCWPRSSSAIHTTTRPELIRRFLLLQRGRQLQRAAARRVGAHSARAAVHRRSVGADGAATRTARVILDVRTSDEVALVLGVAATTASPPVRFVRLGDANLSGEGIYLAGDWRDGDAFRDGFGGALRRQSAVRPAVHASTAKGTSKPLGSDWHVDATHPFYTDIQRIAWRARAGANDDYAQFRERRSTRATRCACVATTSTSAASCASGRRGG